eukprot:366483-Chlamydomonas_euryale.AAC.5
MAFSGIPTFHQVAAAITNPVTSGITNVGFLDPNAQLSNPIHVCIDLQSTIAQALTCLISSSNHTICHRIHGTAHWPCHMPSIRAHPSTCWIHADHIPGLNVEQGNQYYHNVY